MAQRDCPSGHTARLLLPSVGKMFSSSTVILILKRIVFPAFKFFTNFAPPATR